MILKTDQMIKLELTFNPEYLRDFCEVDFENFDLDGGVAEEIVTEYTNKVWTRLEEAGFSVTRPGGNRSLYSQWCGAVSGGSTGFSFSYYCIGTYANLSPEQKELIILCVDKAQTN